MLISDFLLRRLALLLSAFGIAFVVLFSEASEPAHMKISEIGNSIVSKKVSTEGIVLWSRLTKGVLIFELQDEQRIKCVLFSPSSEQLALVRKGRALRVDGTVQSYKGSLEIVAEEVRLVEPN